MSNGNAAAVLMLTVAALAGMSHVHGGQTRRHATTRHWASPERVELGDTRIPVRSVRRHTSYHVPSNPRTVVRRHSDVDEAPEVIVGYVDPQRGPAAFHRLTKVVEGDRVKVVRRDHSVAWFKVDSVRRTPRSPFAHERSADEVRRAIARERTTMGRPELRLISLRGKTNHHHRDTPSNVVVSAHLDRP